MLLQVSVQLLLRLRAWAQRGRARAADERGRKRQKTLHRWELVIRGTLSTTEKL